MMKKVLKYLTLLTILTAFSNCGSKVVALPYDEVIRPLDAACVHPDKDLMQAIYGTRLEELYNLLATCREKGLLKENPE